jgi:hypothetical protein
MTLYCQYIILVFSSLCFVNSVDSGMLSFEVVKKLISESNSEDICLFGEVNSDQDISTWVQLFSKNPFQTCEITQNVLIVIYNVCDQNLHQILKNASQSQLINNIWMVISSENTISPNGRKLALRVQLYQLSLDSNAIIHLTQYLGTGSSFLKTKVKYNLIFIARPVDLYPILQEHGPLDKVNFSAVIAKTRLRKDFQGVTYLAQYGDYPPFCKIITESGSSVILTGLFVELWETFASVINITVQYQKALPKNVNIWSYT